jgi:ribokinase
MNPTFDILGLGCVAVDDLLYVAGYPAADGKVQVQGRERQCGGLTATALVAASRLGSRCAYAGVLGPDELSQFALDCLQREAVDVSRVVRRPDARPIHSFVVVDERRHTRTIFFDLHGVQGHDAQSLAPDVVRAARVLFVDQLGVEGMIRAAEIARPAGIPVVADFEIDDLDQYPEVAKRLPELLRLVDHLILSWPVAKTLSGKRRLAAVAEKLWTPGRQAVVITCGKDGCWYATSDAAGLQHQPAYPVQVVDTTGCGDVFHGAYASALVRRLDTRDRVRFAAAAAALKATRRGGQAGIPTRPVVEAFLREHDS